MQYTRSPAQLKNQVDSEFSMMDGKIQGKFLVLRPH
jgi:hypothetical protein